LVGLHLLQLRMKPIYPAPDACDLTGDTERGNWLHLIHRRTEGFDGLRGVGKRDGREYDPVRGMIPVR
jgi:hypothetical protein